MAMRDIMKKGIKELIPRNWAIGKNTSGIQTASGDPFTSLQREMNRLFDSFARGFFDWPANSTDTLEGTAWGGFSPRVDVKETEKAIEVCAELPGMDEKDVQVNLTGKTLVISGEKKSEQEEKRKEFYRMERTYGSFHRSVQLPDEVETDKAEATFKKGVLQVMIPKRPESRRLAKSIPVKRG